MGALLYILAFLGVFSTVLGFDCKDSKLSDFNFGNLEGLHHVSIVEDTPPSQSNFTWYFQVCGPIKDVEKNPELEGCLKDAQICGVRYVTLPGKDALKTEVISFSDSLKPEFTVVDKEKVSLKLSGANWGTKTLSSTVDFTCDSNLKEEEIKIVKWDTTNLEVSWKSYDLCSKSDKKPDGNKDKDKNKDGDKDKEPNGGHGFFYTIFMFVFQIVSIVLSIYIIGAVWLTVTRRNGTPLNVRDTLNEVTEFLFDLAKNVPGFIKEILDKLMGSNSRGGYSAV